MNGVTIEVITVDTDTGMRTLGCWGLSRDVYSVISVDKRNMLQRLWRLLFFFLFFHSDRDCSDGVSILEEAMLIVTVEAVVVL